MLLHVTAPHLTYKITGKLQERKQRLIQEVLSDKLGLSNYLTIFAEHGIGCSRTSPADKTSLKITLNHNLALCNFLTAWLECVAIGDAAYSSVSSDIIWTYPVYNHKLVKRHAWAESVPQVEATSAIVARSCIPVTIFDGGNKTFEVEFSVRSITETTIRADLW